MAQTLVNSSTKTQLKGLVDTTPHAIGVFGYGSAYRRALINDFVADLAKAYKINPNTILHIVGENGSIGIDAVRAIRSHTRSQAQPDVARLIVIHDAEQLTPEAQNGLLKSLEEPPSDTVYILSAHAPSHLLPTIISRLHSVEIRRLDNEQVGELSPEQKTVVSFLNNNPEFATDNKDQQQLLVQIKSLLAADVAQRIALSSQLYSNRVGAMQLIELTIEVLRGMLQAHINRLDSARTQQLMASITAAVDCHSRLAQNGNIKANLDVFLSAL